MQDNELKQLIAVFLEESNQLLDHIENALLSLRLDKQKYIHSGILSPLLAILHTLKGNSGMLGFVNLSRQAHQFEEFIKENIQIASPQFEHILALNDLFRKELDSIAQSGQENPTLLTRWQVVWHNLLDLKSPKDSLTIPTSTNELDTAPSFELEELHAQATTSLPTTALHTLHERIAGVMIAVNSLNAKLLRFETDQEISVRQLQDDLFLLTRNLRQIQDQVTDFHLLSLHTLLKRIPRIVYDAAQKANKTIDLTIEGENAKADRAIIDDLGNALLHLIRNAIDHGIEPEQNRIALNKPREGKIKIRAYNQGNQVVVIIEDDGCGIDFDKVRKKALAAKIITKEDAQDDEKLKLLLFRRGFSTAEKQTQLSGRGVGLEAVQAIVAKMGGFVQLDTQKDRGTTFRVTVPSTTLIEELLYIEVHNATYALAMPRVLATGHFDLTKQKWQAEQLYYQLTENDLLPIVKPSFTTVDFKNKAYYVLIELSENKVVLPVDRVLNTASGVLRPLIEPVIRRGPYSAATILTNGKVCLILDPYRLEYIKQKKEAA